ncbi:agmatine deiminase family protein [Planctomycetota bacterium]|nr:agmatine deiminase family protein [Planctomycetota bacterium]
MNHAMEGHPRIDGFERLAVLEGTAKSLGYRLPAEFERQRAVLLTRPHNKETWPAGTLEKARDEFEYFVETVKKYTPVLFTDELGFATTDSWTRDYGPITMTKLRVGKVNETNHALGWEHLAYHDFCFDGWGAKYDVKADDDVIPQRFAMKDGVKLWVHDLILEGGSIECNGNGILITTEQCLLNENRNTQLDRDAIEGYLVDAFNLERVIWLPSGITGDDTDGHVDDMTRFISENTVLTVVAEKGHADYEILLRNKAILVEHGLNVIDLPMPEPMWFDFPNDQPYEQAGRQVLPASYANFLITNDAILVPTFGQASDDVAMRVIETAAPNHVIEPVPAETLIIGMGSLHCLSMQVPM